MQPTEGVSPSSLASIQHFKDHRPCEYRYRNPPPPLPFLMLQKEAAFFVLVLTPETFGLSLRG